jgi:hypothetical protein
MGSSKPIIEGTGSSEKQFYSPKTQFEEGCRAEDLFKVTKLAYRRRHQYHQKEKSC